MEGFFLCLGAEVKGYTIESYPQIRAFRPNTVHLFWTNTENGRGSLLVDVSSSFFTLRFFIARVRAKKWGPFW
jgi:hypothetical protein